MDRRPGLGPSPFAPESKSSSGHRRARTAQENRPIELGNSTITESETTPVGVEAGPAARPRAWTWLDLLLVAGLVLAALPARLANLELAAPKSDEGIRLGQLYLMSTGFRPVRDIFASQGPLSLDATFPFYALLGGTLQAARLGVVVYSLALLAACYWLGRQLGGRQAGLLAGLLLALSPVLLKNSRTALVEVPALLPATLAVAAAARYAAAGRPAWAAAAGGLLALALLIKPIVLAAGLAVLLFLLQRPAGRWRGLGLAALAGAGLSLLAVLAYGPTELYDQVVRYRVESARVEGASWSLQENLDQLWDELVGESLAWLALVAVSLPLGLLAGARRALPLLAWLLANLLLLATYSPLQPKHTVILMVPAAVLVGFGFRLSGFAGWLRRGDPRLKLVGAAGLALLVWYAASTPAVLARNRQVTLAGIGGGREALAEDAARLAALTDPADFVVVDEPYLAYLSQRRVPPRLVDPTTFRLRSGTLTSADAIRWTAAHDTRALVLWTDGLRDLKGYGDWIDEHYQAVWIEERSNKKDRTLYLRSDADFKRARQVLWAGLTPPEAAGFGGVLRLAAAGLEQPEVRAGQALTVVSVWQAVAPMSIDYRVVAALESADGQTVAQLERSLGGGGVGTSAWQPGRWTARQFQLDLPARTRPGEYTLKLGLYDSEARTLLPASAGGEMVAVARPRVLPR